MPKNQPIARLEPRLSIITLLVRDLERAYRFYGEGLGFPARRKPGSDWIGFRLQGVCLSIFPYEAFADEKLKRRANAERALDRAAIPAISLAYNTRQKHEVAEVLELARRAGATIEKEPEDTFWGGYSGYFSDPDGHLWEVAWADFWQFNPDGSLIVP
jgi:catechol 2,3-dioxygenase-like lactoylglutathione lyase family enzyme